MQEEEEANPEKISNKIGNKTKKGAADDLSSKVKNSNISDWVVQKICRLGFFEMLKRDFVNESEIPKTYEEFSQPPQIPKEILNYEDKELLELDKPIKDQVEDLGVKVQNIYMKNGLSDSEASARLNRDGPNKLPEKKKVPEIVKIFRELTSPFNLLLWVASALCFLGFGLAPNDISNVKQIN